MTGMAIQDKKIVINGGEQWRPFLHVDDAANLYCQLLDSPKKQINGKIYNVGSNENNMKIKDLAKIISNVIKSVKIINSETEDNRSYKVNFDKIKKDIKWKNNFSIKDGILQIKKMFDNGSIKNFRDINY
jgi:nucleoside-diphosphate-sugar epimerase